MVFFKLYELFKKRELNLVDAKINLWRRILSI